MIVEPTTAPPSAPKMAEPTSSDRTALAGLRSARTYRILFYLAAVVAIAAMGVAWKLKNQPVTRNPMAFTEERDKQYAFIVDAYGYKYEGHTGNVIDECILRYGAWEKDRLFFARDYLKNLALTDAVVIDVGANTGHNTLFYSRCAARVLAFEPYPPVITTFERNLALNPHVKNVELFKVGLGNEDVELPFVAPVQENHGQGSFRTDAPQDPGMKKYEQKLRIVVGDDYLKDKKLGPVAFVKIDVEGFEEPVLKGVRQLLVTHRPMVQVEVSPSPTGTVGSFDDLKSLFPVDYEFFVLPLSYDGIVKGTYQLVKLDPLSTKSRNSFTANRQSQMEIIACPKERLSALPGQ